MKFVLPNFKTTSCQTKLKKWKDCTKDCTYQSGNDAKYSLLRDEILEKQRKKSVTFITIF